MLKQKVSIKANASKQELNKLFRESGANAEALKKFPKTVPVAIAHPVRGANASDAAKIFADLTNNINGFSGETRRKY